MTEIKNKKPRVAFVVADTKSEWMLRMFVNSLRKFHTEEELPLVVIGQKELDAMTDPAKYYKMTPFIAKDLIKEYELVIKFDVDQLIVGDLSYMWRKVIEYDVGTVYNWNRVDPPRFGEVGLTTIAPIEYYNCGLVAMKSEKFVNHWWKLCQSQHFERMPMREQGFLNILTHYGFYRVVCFDDYNPITEESSWWGLRSKGEWNKVVLKNGEMILPVGVDGYPETNKKLKVLHWAGGDGSPKMDYRLYFSEEVIAHLDYLVGDKK